MPRVTVYYFMKYNMTVGETVRSQRPATLETIIVCEGKLLEDTAQQVDVAELDENGFYTPKDTSGTEGGVEGGRGEDSMNTVQQRHGNIADEVRSIRDALRNIAASLHPGSDADQRAGAEKKINDLEKRIDSLEAQKQRGIS